MLAEIAGQPEALRRAAKGLQQQRSALDEVAHRRRSDIVFTGMGASYAGCYPAVTELAGRGRSALMADAAELLYFRQAMLGPDATLIAVSQSGESAEVVRLVEELHSRAPGVTVVSVTNGSANTLTSLSHLSFDTLAGPEEGPSSGSFAASLITLAGIARVLGGDAPGDAISHTRTEAERTALDADRLLVDPVSAAEKLADWISDRSKTVVLARGPARAAAEVGALTLKEAAGCAAEALEAAQFRHGPLELASPELAAIVIATEPETRDLDLALAKELVGYGSAVTVISTEEGGTPGALHFWAGRPGRLTGSAVSLIPIQLLAWRLSALGGRQPGTYLRATKVTTRE